MIMVGANSVLTTKVIRENTRKRFTEVAVAVEEIGNSMTLTLKALAEGKQDIEAPGNRKLKFLLIMEPRLQKKLEKALISIIRSI